MAAFSSVDSRAGICPPVRLVAVCQRDRGGRLVRIRNRPAPSDDDPLS